ncbi:MAG TPA: RNA-binding protein [Verrucomicrobiae bacterium]|jgi:RNA recognition motif-containing protein|nr:RNA-binding protein [Verrucomicrobiae bacterium]
MQKRLYVGNLSYQATEQDVKNHFAKSGEVLTVDIIKDRDTGRSKGFCFVEMANVEGAQKALELNGADLMGRPLTVSEAKPQKPRSDSRREDYRSGPVSR